MPWAEIDKYKLQIGSLKNAIAQGRIAHAYLFMGPKDSAKISVALDFAKALNCENENGPCPNCDSCLAIDKGSHPDIRITSADERMGSIKIDDIRAAQARVFLMPQRANMKVEIINSAEAMTTEAQNAFLKVLEEPPARTVFILISANPDLLYLTIRSRCQALKFPSLGANFVREGLEDIIKTRDEILSRGIFDMHECARVRQEKIIELLCAIYRDALLVKLGMDERLLVNIDRQDEIKKIAGSNSFETLEEKLRSIEKSFDYLRQNVSAKLVFMSLEEQLKCFR
ncbi:MAG: DNA polymerase III subunit delta' C-terminal domain-containing protein [Candidatus Omnitrophota bacterium]